MKPGAVRGGASTTMGCREWLGTRLQWCGGILVCGMRDVMESEIVEKGGRERDRGVVEEGSKGKGERDRGEGGREEFEIPREGSREKGATGECGGRRGGTRERRARGGG